VSAGVFPIGVFTAFVASQRSSAAISLLLAAMSVFCRKAKKRLFAAGSGEQLNTPQVLNLPT